MMTPIGSHQEPRYPPVGRVADSAGVVRRRSDAHGVAGARGTATSEAEVVFADADGRLSRSVRAGGT